MGRPRRKCVLAFNTFQPLVDVGKPTFRPSCVALIMGLRAHDQEVMIVVNAYTPEPRLGPLLGPLLHAVQHSAHGDA
jgi:hypothetical protein